MRKPISKKMLLTLIQQFVAVDSVGTSAVRGQPAGTVLAIRKYLGMMNLDRLPRNDRQDFARWLDLHTGRIQRKLPNRRRPWGIARKTLNLFLRSCFYTHELRKAYGMAKAARRLEVPLDSLVAKGLREDAGKHNVRLPRWRGLKRLTPVESEEFQKHAREYAAGCKLPAPVFLDNYLWLRGRGGGSAR